MSTANYQEYCMCGVDRLGDTLGTCMRCGLPIFYPTEPRTTDGPTGKETK